MCMNGVNIRLHINVDQLSLSDHVIASSQRSGQAPLHSKPLVRCQRCCNHTWNHTHRPPEWPLAMILMRCPQLAMFLNQPVDRATNIYLHVAVVGTVTLWWPPPSLPFSKLLCIKTALVLDVTWGEQWYCGYLLPSCIIASLAVAWISW
jgi:hypothetical protein